MPSLFDKALAQADAVISSVMMSAFIIGGKRYQAVLDEAPNLMSYEDNRVNGTTRTLTMFKSSGYSPKLGDVVKQGRAEYIVRGFSFSDELIVLQLE
jgi:hypothetical protein